MGTEHTEGSSARGVATDDGLSSRLTNREHARKMIDLGYRIAPIQRGRKYPAGIDAWQDMDLERMEAEFDNWWPEGTTNGIGWVMGPQLNGMFVWAVDLDRHDPEQDGVANWKAVRQEHGSVPNTTISRTGGGGIHLVFAAPPDCDIRNFQVKPAKIAPGIDVRGEGGQIVVPPSVHPDTGEFYRWGEGRAPWETAPAMAPDWLIEMARRAQEEQSVVINDRTATPRPARPPEEGEGPADWLRSNWDWHAELITDGWTYRGSYGPDDAYWRPGKHRGEKSALLSAEGAFRVFSAHASLDAIHSAGNNFGAGTVISPIEYLSVRLRTDVAGAAAHVRRTMMPQAEAGPRPDPTSVNGFLGLDGPDAFGVAGTVPEPAGLNLPAEFWNERPWLTHTRDAAWSSYSSPDAVLGSLLVRFAATVHPSIVLPQMGTLDLFTVIVGRSGAGKSSAGKTARRLFPGHVKGVLLDQPVGSGEGLIQSFMGYVDQDGNPCSPTKKGAERVQRYHGMHYVTDEGTGLVSQAVRMGSTLVPTLCQAWMGETLGQRNADPTRDRTLPAGKARITASINMQMANGYLLFDESYSSVGLAQRMLSLSAVDPTIATYGFEAPAWPGELKLPMPPIITGSENQMEVADEIAEHLAAVRKQAHDPRVVIEPLDTHLGLLQLKVAAIIALIEGRFSVSIADWRLAQQIINVHLRVRSALFDEKRKADTRRIEGLVIHEQSVGEKRDAAMLSATVDFILKRIDEGKTLGQGALSAAKRDYYDQAMQHLEERGVVRFDGHRFVAVKPPESA
jgi:hypothetical protein